MVLSIRSWFAFSCAVVAVGNGLGACSSYSSTPSTGGIVSSGGKSGVGTGGVIGSGGGTATGGATGTVGSGGLTGSGGGNPIGGVGSGGAVVGSGGGNPDTGGRGGTSSATGGAGGPSAASGGASQGGATVGAGGGAVAAAPSSGCGMAPPTGTGTIGTTKYGKFSIMINAQSVLQFNATPGQNKPVSRVYYVRLPDGYDQTKPYRVIYVGPGCGPGQDNQMTPKGFQLGSDVANSTGARTQAILVQLEPGQYNPAAYNPSNCQINNTSGCNASSAYCFDDWASEAGTPMVSTIPDGPSGTVAMERAYFDALHKSIEASYCVDKSREFYAGYSSGGWMAQQLGCWFPDVLRAQANVTGGIPPIIRDNSNGANDYCTKHPIAAFLIHNNPDPSNGFQGSVDASKRLFALNGCTGALPGGTMGPPLPNATAALPAGLASYSITGVPNNASFRCYQYTSCPADYPMMFCVATDSGHQNQSTRADPAFWEFFSKF